MKPILFACALLFSGITFAQLSLDKNFNSCLKLLAMDESILLTYGQQEEDARIVYMSYHETQYSTLASGKHRGRILMMSEEKLGKIPVSCYIKLTKVNKKKGKMDISFEVVSTEDQGCEPTKGTAKFEFTDDYTEMTSFQMK